MKTLSIIALIALSSSIGTAAELPRTAPEAQGISSSVVLDFIDAADRDIDALHSFMLLRHGHVVAEGWWAPYNARSRHMLYSLSKSFTSTAVGLAIAEGKLSLDDEVLEFFPDAAPAEPGHNLKEMRVHDLLRMSTGHQTEPPRPDDQPWTRAFLAHPVPFKPGTHFLYNTSGTYMLSAIVQKATGQTVLDYLQPRLFGPLGIENPTWEVSPEGVSTGGYGLSVRTEDIARFGQLYLQKGRWQGQQLVPAAWIEAATRLQTSNGSNPNSDWDQGYGYQFWRCRHRLYRGDGAFGQYCIVMPEQDAVIAITSGIRDMQAVMNLIWDRLLPAMKDTALPADDASARKLAQRLKSLALRTPEGNGRAASVSGRKYVFAANDQKVEAITLEGDGSNGDVTVTIRVDGADRRIVCGRKEWREGRIAWSQFPAQPIAAAGAWTENDIFNAKVCLYETPYIYTIRLKFAGQQLQYDCEANVSFGRTKEPQLIGRAQ
ncbi:MAG: serine hydrolase [Sedimentisphaerales bacterium]|jgi:CubicO group peptidase (beta-lactamase class C family)|nr:serine hydrolase [Sedimentisphaerales bacterium]HNY78972.1 serine hydrolase [Sedimentisphaerales bacterium]HOC64079.1 serine hydrolase [Sedimentisphaerales bacterium]HOH64886.1 serine hydrolase [Sedimentisphaerales bacterium]HPY51520.1 serine hydrolase [Sedimentisphaerales bacterium]